MVLSKKRKKVLAINKIGFWVGLIGLTVLFLRIPSLLEPHRYADEEIYLTLGQGLRKGLVFYKDIHDNKPPMIYLVAALAGNVYWFRFILLIWHGFTLIAFWKLAQTLLKPVKIWLIGLITFVFAVLTTIPFLEGNIANAEIFMIGPAILGAYLIWQNRQSRKVRPFLLAGFLFSLAFLFKVTIFFDLAGIGLFLLFYRQVSLKKRLRNFFSPGLLALLLGFAIPILASIGYYSLQGAFAPYVKAALLQNINYLSSWETGTAVSSAPIWSGGLSQRGIILILLTSVLLVFKKRLSHAGFFVSLWFIFSLFGALLSSRPYPHYFIQSIVPLSLMLVVFFREKLFGKISLFLLFLLLPLTFWHYQFWYYRSLPYYQNFLEYVSKHKSKAEYFAFFDKGINRNYQVANYVLKHALPEENIFIWGTEPAIYALSNRLPVGRYTVSYHIADFNAWQETIKALEKEKPSIIISLTNEARSFPELESFLDLYYTPAQTIEEAVIYQRLY